MASMRIVSTAACMAQSGKVADRFLADLHSLYERRMAASPWAEEEVLDVAAVEQEIKRLGGELADVRVKMKLYLKELGQ